MRHSLFRLCSVLLLVVLQSPVSYSQTTFPTAPADGETPGSLSCIYGLTAYTPGCRISNALAVPNTGSGVIAVIDGGADEDALGELTAFSNYFGLNPLPDCNTGKIPCFQTVQASAANNTCTPGGHAQYNVQIIEPEIDIEWSHAMAPNASIWMVQADSWNMPDMLYAVGCANQLLLSSGGFISFSQSVPEVASELASDSYFQTPGIIYVASSGDYSAPARYPSSSPYVISAGGTSIERDASGNYVDQVAWLNTELGCSASYPGGPCKTGGSGGPSMYEPRPSYQNSVQKIVGNKRGTPDFSFVAQGVDVFCCSYSSDNLQCCNEPGFPANPKIEKTCDSVDHSVCGSNYGTWVRSGGTSLAAPALAGIINSAHSGTTTVAQELALIYNGAIKNYHANWTDITSGNNGYPALTGYDFATGLGVPRGYGGK